MTDAMNDRDPHDLRRHLRALPDPAVPSGLRDRVLATHGRRRRLVQGTTGLAMAAVAAVLLQPALPPPDTTPERITASAQESTSAPVQTAADTGARLRAIDRALQAAYERGASDDEIAPLWRVRESLSSALSLPPSPRNPS